MNSFVYEVKNNINGMTYTGVTTHDIINGHPYMGSGKYLKRAQKKYGIENFTIKILVVCPWEEMAYKIEGQMVDQDAVDDPMCYNLVLGGGKPPAGLATKPCVINGIEFDSRTDAAEYFDCHVGSITRFIRSDRTKFFGGKRPCGEDHHNYGKQICK